MYTCIQQQDTALNTALSSNVHTAARYSAKYSILEASTATDKPELYIYKDLVRTAQ